MGGRRGALRGAKRQSLTAASDTLLPRLARWMGPDKSVAALLMMRVPTARAAAPARRARPPRAVNGGSFYLRKQCYEAIATAHPLLSSKGGRARAPVCSRVAGCSRRGWSASHASSCWPCGMSTSVPSRRTMTTKTLLAAGQMLTTPGTCHRPGGARTTLRGPSDTYTCQSIICSIQANSACTRDASTTTLRASEKTGPLMATRMA
mmetsp:Transcript_1777/g.7095  ORF Transcript_1777/g.7095 Transcript_1777/m.7095 type:complete len:206 (+) Transcript_1777:109-726(+)